VLFGQNLPGVVTGDGIQKKLGHLLLGLHMQLIYMPGLLLVGVVEKLLGYVYLPVQHSYLITYI
jgi:hypothetical protein